MTPRAAAVAATVPRLLSVARIAERWDCHRTTVYKAIADGKLPSVRIGGMVRVPLEAVERMERGGRNGAVDRGLRAKDTEQVELERLAVEAWR